MSRKKKSMPNVLITGIADKGMAVGRSAEGEVVFVEGAVPGDTVDILVIRKKKGVGQGVVQAYKELSKHRKTPFCKHFDDCGGCKWQHLDYQEQIKHKFGTVRDAMVRLAKLDESIMEPIIPSAETVYYRNKLEYAFCNKRYIPKSELEESGKIDPRPALGFHVGGAWDKILDIETCHLQSDPSNDIRNFLRELAVEKNYTFYDVREHKGFFRNVIIRNTHFGQWMVTVVVAKDDVKKIKITLDALLAAFPFIDSLHYVVNQKMNDTIFDQEVKLYHGQPFIIEKLGNIKYKIGPKSFFQTNSLQAKALFDTVVDFAGLTADQNVYDLYTGLGSIALYVADKCKHVTGIEEIPEAIADAHENAKLNSIENVTFYAGDVKNILTDDFADRHGKPDLVITDPPRAGMHADVCQTLLSLAAPTIVYVSCNPSTQARDITILSEKYDAIRVKPVDMFPHTHHVESVALLKLRE